MKRELLGIGLLLAACHPPPGDCANAGRLALSDGPAAQNELLAGLVERAEKAGATATLVVSEGLGSEGDRTGGFLTLPKDRCVLVFARGSKGVGDLDLFVYADDGTALATDESSSAEAAVVVCPPHPDRAYVTARIATGAGIVAIGAAEIAVDKAVVAAGAIGAKSQGEESGRLESWPGLEAKVAAHRKAIGSSWEDVRRFATLVDPRAATRTTVPIEAGRCLDVLVVPSEEVPSLEVVVEDDGGRIVGRAQAEGRDRSLVVCSDAGDTVSVAARPRGGSGLAAFVLGRSPKRAAAEIETRIRIDHVSQGGTAEKARAELAKLVDVGWGKGRPSGSGEARLGRRTNLELKLGAGCSRLDVVAGHPLGPLSAALWDDGGFLLAESAGSSRATLYACGASRTTRLDVESAGRPGPFVVDVRTLADTPAEALKRPLAAARLFDRMIGSGDEDPRILAGVRAIDLDVGKLFSSSFVVPANACTEVVVALDAGSGLDLRVVDEASGEDAIGRGQQVASQRICGNKSSRRAKLEVRVDRGPAPGLVLFRTAGD